MEVVPSQLVIPPHEYRYMCVYFTPRAIQSYRYVGGGQGAGRGGGAGGTWTWSGLLDG